MVAELLSGSLRLGHAVALTLPPAPVRPLASEEDPEATQFTLDQHHEQALKNH